MLHARRDQGYKPASLHLKRTRAAEVAVCAPEVRRGIVSRAVRHRRGAPERAVVFSPRERRDRRGGDKRGEP